MTAHAVTNDLARTLIETWAAQNRDGFLLSDPDTVEIETREEFDARCGVNFRFRWMPHREIRGDVAELERRGILDPDRDEHMLFRDPRDPHARHCFLCEPNIRECHPLERLVPMKLAGRDYFAGANFAWIELDHYTVMSATHTDQAYSRHALEAMCDLHRQAAGQFRVLFNGPGAGASIPWHLHYQITTSRMPIESLAPDGAEHYPTLVQRFSGENVLEAAHAAAMDWVQADEAHHTINALIAGPAGRPVIFTFPRDKRRATSTNKGLVGGFEVAGDFVLSAPSEEAVFRASSVATAHQILSEIRPASGPA